MLLTVLGIDGWSSNGPFASASQPEPAFEVISIKSNGGAALNTALDAGDPCSGGADARLHISGNRVSAPLISAYGLIAVAFNPWGDPRGGCSLAKISGLIAAGPTWIESDRFAVEAVIPRDRASDANTQLQSGEAPILRLMLQTLLRERFQLVVRHEMRQIPIYLLTLSQDMRTAQSKIASSASLTGGVPERWGIGIFSGIRAGQEGSRYWSLAFKAQTMAALAQRLVTAQVIQRPVFDHTGLAGEFDFVLEFDDSGVARPTLFAALQEQLGLRIQPSNASMEVLVIERIERPSAN